MDIEMSDFKFMDGKRVGVLLYFVWSIAVLVFDADIWLRNKLGIEKLWIATIKNSRVQHWRLLIK